MHRRDFLALSSTAAAAGLLLDPRDAAAALQPQPAAQPAGPALPWAAPFDSAPCVQNATPESAAITVGVSTISTAFVEFGPSDALGQRVDASLHGLLPLNGRVHAFRLTGLKPGSRYSYRVTVTPIDFRGTYKIAAGKPVQSPIYRFTTPDGGAGQTARFSIINDTHERPDTLAAMTAQLARTPADLHFWNGDIFNDIRSDDHLLAQVLRPANAPYAAEVPMNFVAGNHDVRGIHARNLDRFVPPIGDRRYYALRQGPVAIVVLDTGEDKPDDHKAYAGLSDFSRYRKTQAEWLKGAVQSPQWRTAPFRVALLHIPLWGEAASEDSRRCWHSLLEEGRTDLVVNGHVHKYLYSPPDASHRYAQLVGGGPDLAASTFVHVSADAQRLSLRVTDAAGTELAVHTQRPA